jgi:hypothetical protein
MRLLLVSEGKNELRTTGERGALQILVERLINRECEIVTRKVSDPAIATERGKGDGMFKRFVAWMRYAARVGFDGLVLVIDEDGDSSRLRQTDDAQAATVVALPRALGLAIQSFDAWILADEVAVSAVLEITVGRQRDMESNRDPKSDCQRLCEGKFGLSDFYAQVAEVANLPDIVSRCPKGFAPFARRLRALMNQVG